MRVNGPGITDQANKTKKKQNINSPGGFDAYLSASGNTEEAAAASGLGALSGIGALLSLQELDSQGEGNAKAYKHAEDILEQLSDLRMGLLAGLIPPEKLQNLASLVKASRQDDLDPRLQDILNDIEVRALVELEKFNKTKANKAAS